MGTKPPVDRRFYSQKRKIPKVGGKISAKMLQFRTKIGKAGTLLVRTIKIVADSSYSYSMIVGPFFIESRSRSCSHSSKQHPYRVPLRAMGLLPHGMEW